MKGKTPHLKLKQVGLGVREPYCYSYSLSCGGCGHHANVRALRKFKILGIGCIGIKLQCDHCSRKWSVTAYLTKKNVVTGKNAKKT